MSFEYRFSMDLFNARTARGWTQPYVANCLSISLREYQNIESGRASPHLKTFLRLTFLFDLDVYSYREVLSVDSSIYSR